MTKRIEMDIDLLAKMISELAVEHDEIALPEFGSFVAELSPAVYSDKGFSIVPPYRKLSFRRRLSADTLLVDKYADLSGKSTEEAGLEILAFLREMEEVLKSRKVIIFPGLGKLRATRENVFFFVPEPGLDIYPDGFGLEPISLKSHSSGEATVIVPKAVSPNAAERPEQEVKPEQETKPEQGVATGRKRSSGKALGVALVLVGILVVAAALLAILGRVAPEFVDRILYSAEDYVLLHP